MTNDKSLVCFDTETTGIDVESDRIVTAFIGRMGRDGEWIESRSWIINPGVDIPEEASEVHGITTAFAQEHGVDPEVALNEIVETLLAWVDPELHPLVVYNAPYDLSILDRELRRHLNYALPESVYETVIDPLVVDKAVDKYRKGSRKLVDTAAHYGVPVEENAHDAGADCLMTGRIAWKIIEKYKRHPSDFHFNSIAWKAEQAQSLQEYLRRSKDPEAVVDGSWPIKHKED